MKYTKLVPSNTGICNNKMAIITWGEKPTAVLIESKEIVKKQTEFFKELWEEI